MSRFIQGVAERETNLSVTLRPVNDYSYTKKHKTAHGDIGIYSLLTERGENDFRYTRSLI